jgi:hypothetical protein
VALHDVEDELARGAWFGAQHRAQLRRAIEWIPLDLDEEDDEAGWTTRPDVRPSH